MPTLDWLNRAAAFKIAQQSVRTLALVSLVADKCLELRTSARVLLVERRARVISLRSFSLLPAWWDAKQQEQKKCETQPNDWYDQSV